MSRLKLYLFLLIALLFLERTQNSQHVQITKEATYCINT